MQFDFSFAFGNSVISFDNHADHSQLRLCLSGKRNMGIEKLKDIFFFLWEMLYFCIGFFPKLQYISFDGVEDQLYPKRIARHRSTTENLSLKGSYNRLCGISIENLNGVTLRKYQALKAELETALNSIFAVQSYKDIYGEHRLLLASQAAEGIIEGKYDSAIAKANRSFRGRIEFLFAPLLTADRKHKTKLFRSIGLTKMKYFELLKETRHFYTHCNRERKRFTKGTEFVADYWILSIAVRLFIMQEIGMQYDGQLLRINALSIASWMTKYRKQ